MLIWRANIRLSVAAVAYFKRKKVCTQLSVEHLERGLFLTLDFWNVDILPVDRASPTRNTWSLSPGEHSGISTQMSSRRAQQEVSVQSVHIRASSKGSVLFWRVTCAICSFAVNTIHRANPSLINYSHSLWKMNYKKSPWGYKKSHWWHLPQLYTRVSAVPASLTSNLKFHVLQKSLGVTEYGLFSFLFFFCPINCLSSMFNSLLFLAY